MDVSPLENLALKYGNKVVYDSAGGVAGVFVRFPKMKSSELDPSLPNHTHPAFIVNGVEKDCIWLGKYKAGVVDDAADSPIVSLPNIDPAAKQNADTLLARMKAAGSGITGMTVADWGFLLLLCQKEGWVPKGNTLSGCSHLDGTYWSSAGVTYSAGAVRVFAGWTYICLQTHASSLELKPDISPEYWEKGEHIGGVMTDSGLNSTHGCPYRVFSGSGPQDWFLGGDPGSLCQVVGNGQDFQYGYRIVNGEIQILPDNDAASPTADLSAGSGAWRAILPHAADDGYELVAPGTSGTLHWNYSGNVVRLDTAEPTFDSATRRAIFKDLTANSANLPYVPHIVRELGLFPTVGSATPGNYAVAFTRSERMPVRGAAMTAGGYAGLGYVMATNGRTATGETMTARPRWTE